MRSASGKASSGLGALLVGCVATLFIASRWECSKRRRLQAGPSICRRRCRRSAAALPGQRVRACASSLQGPLSTKWATAWLPLQIVDQ